MPGTSRKSIRNYISGLWRPGPGKAVVLTGGAGLLLALGLTAYLLWPSSSSAELTCSRLPALMQAYHVNHYAMKHSSPEILRQAVDQMIKRLDPAKTLLYASDVETLKPLLAEVFESAKRGNCASLGQVYGLLVERAKENETLVKKILGPDFQPDRKAVLIVNAEKRPYPKNAADKQVLLKKMIQFQMENALLAGIEPAEARKRQIHRYELQTRRIIEQNPAELITVSAEAFARALDPHTSYLSPKNLEDLQISMQLSLEGIGAVLSSDNGFTVIEELIPGGGAEKTGLLKPKDKIIAVAQEGEKPVDVIDMDLRDVISMIRGRKGTRVTLTILRQGERRERFHVTILRDKIDMKEQEAKITYETRNTDGRIYRFGVIDLPSFYGGEKGGKSCYQDVKRILAEARREGVDGIVLNLSRNTGGMLDEAVRLAGLFIGDGPVVAVRDSRGGTSIFVNGLASGGINAANRDIIQMPREDVRSLYPGPLVVLTSRLSASASEIVAGALQDYRRAVIVGSDHTYGKGSVQTLMKLPWELGAMKVTTGLYFLPGGQSTQKKGVAADIILPGWFALEEIGEAGLDYSLPAQAIEPFLGRQSVLRGWKPVNDDLIAALDARSQVRVAKDVKFVEILKDNREAAEKRGVIRLEDLHKKGNAEENGKENETPAEQRRKAQEQYAPFVRESVNILFDMVTNREGKAAGGNARRSAPPASTRKADRI